MGRVLAMLPLVAAAACASSQYPDIDEPMPPALKASSDGPALGSSGAKQASAISEGGKLQRTDVERVVDAGLGRFLSHVALEPSLTAGKFAGWSIVSLRPPELWRAIDLKPGDVVTRVNGMSIERETEAYDAFQAVRQASTIEVSLLRQGQLRTLRFDILGPPSLPRAPSRDSGRPSAVPAPG